MLIIMIINTTRYIAFQFFLKATQQSYITKQKLLNIMQSCVDAFEAVVAMLIL